MKRLLILFLFAAEFLFSATRIKDLAYIQGMVSEQLIGYGLVVGLNGTGDSQRSTFTIQSVSSMLKRFGITVPQNDLRLRNVAAVMVTASLPPFSKSGGVMDVTVSSLGDATGLQGGTLLVTPLSTTNGAIYASAQGAISVGGMNVRSNGSEVRRNHTAAGRIPGGAIIEKPLTVQLVENGKISIVLWQADFTTAKRIAGAIDTALGTPSANAIDASTIAVDVPASYTAEGKLVEFISILELLEITPDVSAKVVINEKTGTIVVGGNVQILPVAISHAGLNIEIQQTPIISQPPAFSNGRTVVTPMSTISTNIDTTSVVAINGAATVQEIAKALNTLKVTPRDIIAIFQALKEAGALKAELVIL
ncbi:MAG: flagellar basal body P-ring protein FlgI [Bacteroidetes bacterium]|nr:flagellar basal body P-ring protein FlgI [Bacteroidota bacterium]